MQDSNEVKKMDMRQAREWLSGDVEIRMPKLWLAIATAVFVALAFAALD